MSYKYYMPTKVIVGANCIVENYEMFKTVGTKALIVTGKRSAKVNGSEADVKKALDMADISYVVYDKVVSNPTVECVYEGANIAKEHNADFVIAIGGGSPIDAAKAMALVAKADIKQEDLFAGGYTKALPLIAVPTTAGTGSEATQYSIITNDAAKTKSGIASDAIFPVISFLDAKYMEKLPVSVTINTSIDALSHALEGMMSARSNLIADGIAFKSIRMIVDLIPTMIKAKETDDISLFINKVREELLVASFLAGMVIAQTGTTTLHAMGYSLTYFKDIDHGRANGILLGECMKLVEEKDKGLCDSVLNAMNLSDTDMVVNMMNDLFTDRVSLSESEIEMFADIVIKAKNIANSTVKPNKEEIIKIYIESFK